ncbi:MAG: DUF6106 family protein [Eubacterium sp.]|nr:DUF6106 family protein [Eubacterium sp.]
MDRYDERLVEGKRDPLSILGIVGGILLIIIGILMFLFGILPSVTIFIVGAGIVCIVLAKDFLSIEYEYIITNGDIEVSKIMSKKRRKTVMNMASESIAILDLAESDKVKNDISLGKHKVKRFIGSEPDTAVAVYYGEGDNQQIILLDFNDKCIEHMKLTLKAKCAIKK